MAKAQKDEEGRVLTSTEIKVGKNTFTLLNSEKLGRVLNWFDGTDSPQEKNQDGSETTNFAALQSVEKLRKKDEGAAILALYDRLGGAIRLGERILRTGTFWDSNTRLPVEKVDLTEDDFGDQYELVPKKTRKTAAKESPDDRIKRLRAKQDLAKEESVE